MSEKSWWAKYVWPISPKEKINLEVDGKTRFIGAPREPSILAVLPRDFQQVVTAFVTEEELKALLDGNKEELDCEINKVFKIKIRKLKYVNLIRGENNGGKGQDNDGEKTI
jgi:hypothetical protein